MPPADPAAPQVPVPDAPPAGSSSNRPATPSDAPPAATPEGLREALRMAYSAEAGEPLMFARLLRAIDAAGYAVVPKEPTEAMFANTVDPKTSLPRVLEFTTVDDLDKPFLMIRFAWRAMLAAAPRP